MFWRAAWAAIIPALIGVAAYVPYGQLQISWLDVPKLWIDTQFSYIDLTGGDRVARGFCRQEIEDNSGLVRLIFEGKPISDAANDRNECEGRGVECGRSGPSFMYRKWLFLENRLDSGERNKALIRTSLQCRIAQLALPYIRQKVIDIQCGNWNNMHGWGISHILQMKSHFNFDAVCRVSEGTDYFETKIFHPWPLGGSQGRVSFFQCSPLQPCDKGQERGKQANIGDMSERRENIAYEGPTSPTNRQEPSFVIAFVGGALSMACAIASLRQVWPLRGIFWLTLAGAALWFLS